MTLCVLFLAVTTAPAKPLWFVQITDTHFGTGKDHTQRTLDAIKQINALPIELSCVIHTGDIGSDNLWKPDVANAASNALAQIKVPVIKLPGNHDIMTQRLESSTNVWHSYFGPLATRFDAGELTFLALYTEPLRKPVTIPGYDPIDWLNQQLKEVGDRPVIVCHHSPSAADFYHNQMHMSWPERNRKRWQQALQHPNIDAILTGHYHRDELHWVGEKPLYVASSIAGYWGRQGSFRLYRYEDGKLSYHTIYLE